MNRRLLIFAGVFGIALVGCSTGLKSKANVLEATLLGYERALRWGNFTEAMSYLDPDADATKAIKPIDLERLAQFDIKGYRRQAQVLVDKSGVARQIVEIEFVNRHTLTPKSSVDQQAWRFDSKSRQWRLTSGLPTPAGQN